MTVSTLTSIIVKTDPGRYRNGEGRYAFTVGSLLGLTYRGEARSTLKRIATLAERAEHFQF